MKKFVQIKIFGQVQRVFFRTETQKIALSLGLAGYVRNLDDGTVEIVAEGEEKNLKKLIEWSKRGPDLAKVEKINIEWANATGNFSDFQIE